jgi:plasmid stabilization system protein ParE
MRRLEFFPAARADLVEIGNWIARRSGNRKTGRAFVER